MHNNCAMHAAGCCTVPLVAIVDISTRKGRASYITYYVQAMRISSYRLVKMSLQHVSYRLAVVVVCTISAFALQSESKLIQYMYMLTTLRIIMNLYTILGQCPVPASHQQQFR